MTLIKELLKKCETVKVCNRCKNLKDLFTFSINKASKDGLQDRCKECDKAYQKQRRSENKESFLEYGRNYQAKRRQDFEYLLQMLLNASKQRALLKNREHSITVDDLIALWPVDGNCPVFGFPLQFNSGGFRETSPSVDRIDSTKGYTLDNIQILSWKANRIKAYATVEELEAVVSFMKQGE